MWHLRLMRHWFQTHHHFTWPGTLALKAIVVLCWSLLFHRLDPQLCTLNAHEIVKPWAQLREAQVHMGPDRLDLFFKRHFDFIKSNIWGLWFHAERHGLIIIKFALVNKLNVTIYTFT